MLAKVRALKKERAAKGLSQAELASKAGYAETTIQRIERGKPTFYHTAQCVAQALGVDLLQIFKFRSPLRDPGMWPHNYKKKVNFIQHFGQKPGPDFTTTKILQMLARTEAEVNIIGRTCRSWLVGSDQASTDNLQNLIVEAANNHSKIHFIIQKATVNVPFFSDEDSDRLRKHLRESIISYLEIQKKLSKRHIRKDRIKLFFIDQPILQSMTKIRRKQDEYEWLLVSIRTDFKTKERGYLTTKSSQGYFEWDPQMIFRTDTPQAKEYDNKFKFILQSYKKQQILSTESPVEYRRYRTSLLESINEMIKLYKHGSRLRRDTGTNLAVQAIRHFVCGSADDDVRLPPMCVHLLVTSRCPSGCPMCKQGKRRLRDLSINEVKDLLCHISALGARSVVISGGDPLYREDIFEILKFACKGDNLPSRKPLALGMMTRGICLKNGKVSALDKSDAICLAKACRWIQISMDTFKTCNTISAEQRIEKNWDLDKAVTSAQHIWDQVNKDKSRAEICFTIHRGNIEEIDSIPENTRKNGIPEGMPIRLKFAHSRTAEADFLCDQQDLYGLKKKLRELAKEENFNSKYLWDMMDSDAVMVRDVANGHPVESALSQFEKLGYKCYVQNLICTIDCDGKVYPCCYLLDDTAEIGCASNSIGDLWDSASNSILSFEHHPVALTKIWQDSTKNPDLPVVPHACARCTRHLHQNQFLNKIQRILSEGNPLGIAEELKDALNAKKAVSECKWCKPKTQQFWL